jgi:hypothetical protein
MRIWDVNPGYLNRQSLLGEHRELHAVVSIIKNRKKGYSRHPETIRWIGHGWALNQRHRLLAAEMAFRGYTDKSPVLTRTGKDKWPDRFVDEPLEQFQILSQKYQNKEQGRIPLPENAQQLWDHHKYSILARDQALYKALSRKAPRIISHKSFADFAMRITEVLRKPPSSHHLQTALKLMWQQVSDAPNNCMTAFESWSFERQLKEIQIRTPANKEPTLMASTAISKLMAWIRYKPD